MKTMPHKTQEIAFYLIALFFIAATLVKVIPEKDYVNDLERIIEEMECNSFK
tara:strand:+ start:5687 stop:5842 length:156 start_codon:yes stop_codon:yes gene_type:complete